jgi:hypothetical protein
MFDLLTLIDDKTLIKFVDLTAISASMDFQSSAKVLSMGSF